MAVLRCINHGLLLLIGFDGLCVVTRAEARNSCLPPITHVVWINKISYNTLMRYEWDDAKNLSNKSKHGIGLDAVNAFDWETAVLVNRSRHADGEPRFAAIGLFKGKKHTVVYTERDNALRIISFRRSNKSEERIYENTLKATQICR